MEAARKLESKILSASAPLAVFALYGSWTATRVTTDSFKTQCRLTPDRLVGVYDINASVSDIADDFAEAGIR
jgi:hypothetical protein